MPEPTSETTEIPSAERQPPAVQPASVPSTDPLVERELLVEDVSIDGMCGVY